MSKVKCGSCDGPWPSRAGSAGARRRRRPARLSAAARGPPEHSRNRAPIGCTASLPDGQAATVHRRTADHALAGQRPMGPLAGDWHTFGLHARQASRHHSDRQAQQKTRRPHGRTLSISSGPHSTARGPAHPDRDHPLARAHRDRWCVRPAPCAPSCRRRPHHRHRVPQARCSGRRRQGSCRYPQTSPSGRLVHRSLRLTAFALIAALVVGSVRWRTPGNQTRPASRSSWSSGRSGPAPRSTRQRQDVRLARPLVRRVRHGDLQPLRDVVQGQGSPPRAPTS